MTTDHLWLNNVASFVIQKFGCQTFSIANSFQENLRSYLKFKGYFVSFLNILLHILFCFFLFVYKNKKKRELSSLVHNFDDSSSL